MNDCHLSYFAATFGEYGLITSFCACRYALLSAVINEHLRDHDLLFYICRKFLTYT